MIRRSRAARVAAAVLVAVLADTAPPAAAESGNAERFIQGTWSHSGIVPGSPADRPMSWYIEWTFANGRFIQNGYPPLHSEGFYRVVTASDAALTLRLFEQKGNFSETDRTIEIVLDPGVETLSINKSPALRRKPPRER